MRIVETCHGASLRVFMCVAVGLSHCGSRIFFAQGVTIHAAAVQGFPSLRTSPLLNLRRHSVTLGEMADGGNFCGKCGRVLEFVCIFAVEKNIDKVMDGVSLQVNLPDYGKYDAAELTQILTRIALRLIGKEAQQIDAEGFPCALSVEEAKAITLQRGREIKAGSVKLFPHEEVMDELNQLVSTYAD